MKFIGFGYCKNCDNKDTDVVVKFKVGSDAMVPEFKLTLCDDNVHEEATARANIKLHGFDLRECG